jgi:hypothetical protein
MSPSDINTLHADYQRLARLPLRLDMHREAVWFEWGRRGFTADDLRCVITYLRGEIRAGRRHPAALKFSNLIGQPDYFEEDLALARAQARPRQPATRTVQTGDTQRIIPDAGAEPRVLTPGPMLARYLKKLHDSAEGDAEGEP